MSAVVDFPVKPEARPYLDAAARARPGEPDWLAQRRRRALARFAEQGFPSRRGEAWRYLDLRPLEQAPLLPAAAGTASGTGGAARRFAEFGVADAAARVVFVDGCFSSVLSAGAGLPSGLSLLSTSEAVDARPQLVETALEALSRDRDQPFAALNAASFTDGFVLEAAPGVVLDRPIEIVHIASGGPAAALYTRSLVALGAHSRVRLIETFSGEGRYWRNDVIAVRLAAGAILERVTLVEEADDAIHFAVLDAALGPAARLTSFELLLGGGTVRHESVVRSEGRGAYCGLHGGFVASGRQQANIVTTVDHLAERGETREVFKGVAAGRAHGAFQGRITVRPGAQKVDAHMLSRNLLLGTRAAIDTKPELEIFADDVKCSHGAAVGDLDEAALFYLLARGIPREEARHMLIEAFIREAVEIVEPGAVREHLLDRLARRLAALED
ncbi:MAG TPA: Fe-S cluster assembly protein SufD [Stellaceae bacterium]|nr:Fe-S cluster assembly protein SufD [Stellaceae bacterium]